MALRDPYLHARFWLGELCLLLCRAHVLPALHPTAKRRPTRQSGCTWRTTTRVRLIRYASVRGPGHGMNLALLTCRAFTSTLAARAVSAKLLRIPSRSTSRPGTFASARPEPRRSAKPPNPASHSIAAHLRVIFGLLNCAGLAVPIKRDGRGRCLDAGAMRSRVEGRYQLGQHRAPNQIIHLVCHIEPGGHQSEQTRPFGIHRLRAVS
jgi:hypothetical protein